MKLLVDLNLSPRWIQLLTNAGFNVVHWTSVGALDAPDSEIMSYAASQSYVVLTHDLDFGAILAATQRRKPSVVQLRASDVRPEVIGLQVVAALRQLQVELDNGALITVDPTKTRVRILPLVPRA